MDYYWYLKIGCLFVIVRFPRFYVLCGYVLGIIEKPSLMKDAMGFLSWHFVTKEKILIFKFLWIEKLENYFYFYFGCGNGTWHTSLYFKLFFWFCFVCYSEIFWTMHPPFALLVPSESSLQGGLHGLCFMAFGPRCKSYWISKFSWIKKLKNYFILFWL